MGKVTESIFDGERFVVPMPQVSFIEKHGDKIQIVMESSEWDHESNDWNKPIWLEGKEKDKFLDSWCRFRHEIDGPFENPTQQ